MIPTTTKPHYSRIFSKGSIYPVWCTFLVTFWRRPQKSEYNLWHNAGEPQNILGTF